MLFKDDNKNNIQLRDRINTQQTENILNWQDKERKPPMPRKIFIAYIERKKNVSFIKKKLPDEMYLKKFQDHEKDFFFFS